jgi:hypothetical protein
VEDASPGVPRLGVDHVADLVVREDVAVATPIARRSHFAVARLPQQARSYHCVQRWQGVVVRQVAHLTEEVEADPLPQDGGGRQQVTRGRRQRGETGLHDPPHASRQEPSVLTRVWRLSLPDHPGAVVVTERQCAPLAQCSQCLNDEERLPARLVVDPASERLVLGRRVR